MEPFDLLGPLPASDAPFGLRIFNPDGSEAEKESPRPPVFVRTRILGLGV